MDELEWWHAGAVESDALGCAATQDIAHQSATSGTAPTIRTRAMATAARVMRDIDSSVSRCTGSKGSMGSKGSKGFEGFVGFALA
jgi:hypothetical protein